MRCFIRVQVDGKTSEVALDTEDDLDKIWTETKNICADLVSDAARNLAEDSEWKLELLDESGNALFRIRLIAETS